MPYKSVGVWVYIKRKGKWVRFRKCASADAARRMATALNIKMHEEGE